MPYIYSQKLKGYAIGYDIKVLACQMFDVNFLNM